MLHAYEENGVRKYVQSYYGHVETMLVRPGDDVRRGQQIATVGTANGAYLAHLHFEMREFITPFVGPGYRRTRAAGSIPANSSRNIAAPLMTMSARSSLD